MQELTYKLVETEDELKSVFDVRQQVFVEEQGISPDLVFSGDDDPKRINVIVREGASVIGAARVQLLAGNTAKVERMAVVKKSRRHGIGRGIISFLNEELKRRHIGYVFLHAQHTALDFYRFCGYKKTGRAFYEAGIKHFKMETRF